MTHSISDLAHEILLDHLEDSIEFLAVAETLHDEESFDERVITAVHSEANRQLRAISIAYSESALQGAIDAYGAPA